MTKLYYKQEVIVKVV